ncbi:enoyl-CoA hydratase/isomerase family protein [Pollutimonas bauzanensis]|uniref:Enoyl-CoA hydratase/carnithine racemase n=1 Tax=Pollutimonas bauzanensis TaxID=658167 RepID=A0A1M5QKJ4_9BURK|nr:enoyl-CoA hydratase/isomerase family protein [Pollutimonas bauzanensis]SHH14622.1 Enoyl-CoA hydratase/carnithine racemase [Pollutimonas bauzanensis]
MANTANSIPSRVSDDVRFEYSNDDTVLHVILDRPSKRNAISPDMARIIKATLESRLDDRVHVVLIRSAARNVFCAGFDIACMGGAAGDPAAALYDLYVYLERLRQVTVAFGDGLLIGGGVELFLCCDLRLASPHATFRMPPAKLSLVYEQEGIARFIRRIGLTATMEMFITGRTITATEALHCGLATRILAEDAVQAYCTDILQGAPLAQQAMKEIIISTSHIQSQEGEQQRHFEDLKRKVAQSLDHKEALAAFREKRPPRFRGQ